ncbi:Proactivator polypeptide, partial [Globisporangium splendens]
MQLWRVLALSAAVCAVSGAHGAAASTIEGDDNAESKGLFSFLTQELQRQSELVQRFFWANPEAPTTTIVIVEDEGFYDGENDALTRQEQQLACLTAVQVLHERDELKQERQQLAKRLRSPFKRAFQVLSLQYDDETSCEDLEDVRLVDECVRVLDMEDEVREFMTRGRSDEQVCTLVRETYPVETQQVGGELSCKLCKRFVQMVVQALEQEMSSVEQVREIIGDICDSMSADSMCHTFLKQYDQIVEWLKHGTDPVVVCLQLTMCPAPKEVEQLADLTSLALKETDNGHACFYCTKVSCIVRYVSKMFPSQLDTVHQLLKFACKLTPQDCKCELLDQNFNKIVAWAKQGKTPHEICVALNICKKTDDAWALPESQESIQEALTALVPLADFDANQDDKKCFYCDYITTLIQIVLQEDPDQVNEIREYADLICGILGDDNVCHEYVGKLDTVVDQLKKGKHPREICTELKYCGAKTLSLFGDTESSAVQDNQTCLYCDYVALALHVIMQQDADQVDQVREYADMICGFMGADNVCHQYVDKLDVMIDELKKGKHPREICMELNFCTKSMNALPGSVENAVAAMVATRRSVDVRDDKKCFYCDYVATMIQVILQEDADQVDEIREYADLICGMLGTDNVCHKYVDQLDTVIDQLKKGKHPREICASLKYCSAKIAVLPGIAREDEDLSSFDQGLVKVVKNSMESAIDGCFVCTQLTSVIEVALEQDPAQIDQIRQIADLCRPYIDKLDEVIDSLKKGEKPKAICHDMKFCRAARGFEKVAQSSLSASSPTSDKGNTTCAYCSGVVTVLEYALKQQPDQVQEAREAAGIVCELLPADDKCHQDLKWFDLAVSQLKSGKQPREICQNLQFCSSAAEVNSIKLPDLKFLDPSLAPSRCSICKQNSLLVASMITKPDSLATFTDEMNSVCRLIPDSKECELLMKHRDTIVDALKNNEDVETICTRIRECEPLSQVAKPVDSEKFMSMGCLLCEYTAEMLAHAARNQNELRLAKLALETMCTILPPSAKCDVLSSKFDELVTLVDAGKSPSQACHSVALCDAAFVEAPEAGQTERPDYLLPAQFAQTPVGELVEVA